MKPNLGFRVCRGWFKSILHSNLGDCWYQRMMRAKRSSLYLTVKIRKGSH